MTDQYPPNHPLHRATAADLEQLAALNLTLANAPGRESYAIRRIVDGELERVTWVPWAEANAQDDVIGYIIRKWVEAQEQPATTPEPTPAQRFSAAHRALEDALAELSRAHSLVAGGTPGILVDWVVVTATHLDLGGGESATDHGIFGPIEGASYRAVGLLETGRDRLRFALNATDPT